MPISSDLPWWHTIDLPGGRVTPGGWDLRPTAERMPWPSALSGMRCLDVGTMDGFWAFEMEHRGGAEVVAVDLADQPRQQFLEAHSELGSKVEYRRCAIHELSPDSIGTFDLVVVGYVLQMVADPLGALAAVRSVCTGSTIVLETVSLPLCALPSPIARLNARRDGHEWFVFNRAGLVRAMKLGGFEVDAVTRPFRDHPGPGTDVRRLSPQSRLMHATGVRGMSVAVRGR
jgi:SAM-dependent methyltransferase